MKKKKMPELRQKAMLLEQRAEATAVAMAVATEQQQWVRAPKRRRGARQKKIGRFEGASGEGNGNRNLCCTTTRQTARGSGGLR
jgi:hypothetical protein